MIVPNAKKRLSIDKIKKHKFFNGIQWSDVESGKCRVPRVLLKEPKAENFDEISYDSDDEDFAHEFQSYEDATKPNQNQDIDLKVSNVESTVRGEEVKENETADLNVFTQEGRNKLRDEMTKLNLRHLKISRKVADV